jgi:hypothetical protein
MKELDHFTGAIMGKTGSKTHTARNPYPLERGSWVNSSCQQLFFFKIKGRSLRSQQHVFVYLEYGLKDVKGLFIKLYV